MRGATPSDVDELPPSKKRSDSAKEQYEKELNEIKKSNAARIKAENEAAAQRRARDE